MSKRGRRSSADVGAANPGMTRSILPQAGTPVATGNGITNGVHRADGSQPGAGSTGPPQGAIGASLPAVSQDAPARPTRSVLSLSKLLHGTSDSGGAAGPLVHSPSTAAGPLVHSPSTAAGPLVHSPSTASVMSLRARSSAAPAPTGSPAGQAPLSAPGQHVLPGADAPGGPLGDVSCQGGRGAAGGQAGVEHGQGAASGAQGSGWQWSLAAGPEAATTPSLFGGRTLPARSTQVSECKCGLTAFCTSLCP